MLTSGVYTQNLTLEDTEELYDDITMHLSLEKSESNLEFWRAMMVVCSAALEILRTERSIGRQAFLEQNRANEAVKNDITNLLKGKTLAELRQLQDSIRGKLSSGDPIDVEYWEGLLKELAVWMAKVRSSPKEYCLSRLLTRVWQAKLRAMHEVVLWNRLEHLRRRQRDEAVRVQNELANVVQDEEEDEQAAAAPSAAAEGDDDASKQEAWSDRMAPKLVARIPMEDQKLQLLDPREDLENLVRHKNIESFLRMTDFAFHTDCCPTHSCSSSFRA